MKRAYFIVFWAGLGCVIMILWVWLMSKFALPAISQIAGISLADSLYKVWKLLPLVTVYLLVCLGLLGSLPGTRPSPKRA